MYTEIVSSHLEMYCLLKLKEELMRKVSFIFHAAEKSNMYYYSTSLSRVQITPKTSTNISVFVLQMTGLTSFPQTSGKAENASFPDIVRLNKTVSLE